MKLSQIVSPVVINVLFGGLDVVDSFGVASSTDLIDAAVPRSTTPQHEIVFPIERTSGDGGGISTEIDVGNSISSAFEALVDSSEFLVDQSSPADGHRLSSCSIPGFGDSAALTFAPRPSTCGADGEPVSLCKELTK